MSAPIGLADTSFEYKYVIIAAGSSPVWEGGQNRIADLKLISMENSEET